MSGAIELVITEKVKSTYPGAALGVLLMHNVANPAFCPALQQRKASLEESLRGRFGGSTRAALKALPILQAYATYYRRFNKTYHVLLQLEGVALKGQSIPTTAALVEAMFMAELEDLLLTAGHDAGALHVPLTLDAALGHEQYVMLNGQQQTLKAGDMLIADAQGVISSILYGPDQRTRFTSETRCALFTTYAPAGIAEQSVRQHLQNVRDNVLLSAAQAIVDSLEVYPIGALPAGSVQLLAEG
jgi:DNA/RNA-binding domain of Phe-tRNA-synthetase-like protein